MVTPGARNFSGASRNEIASTMPSQTKIAATATATQVSTAPPHCHSAASPADPLSRLCRVVRRRGHQNELVHSQLCQTRRVGRLRVAQRDGQPQLVAVTPGLLAQPLQGVQLGGDVVGSRAG